MLSILIAALPALTLAPSSYTRKLSDGTEVRLAYVLNMGSKPWRPDGKAASAAQEKECGFFAKWKPNSRHKEQRGVFMRFETKKQEGAMCRVRVKHKSTWNVWQTYGGDSDESLNLAGFLAPNSMKTCDVEFGIPFKPYKTFIVSKMKQGPLMAVATVPPPPAAGAVCLLQALVTIQVPQHLREKDLQLIAYDSSGNTLDLQSWDSDHTTDQTPPKKQLSFEFSGAEPSSVAKVELRYRDVEWLTFKNVHLYPNSK